MHNGAVVFLPTRLRVHSAVRGALRRGHSGLDGIEGLSIRQKGHVLEVEIALSPGSSPLALWIHRVPPSDEEWTRVAAVTASGGLTSARIDLFDLPRPGQGGEDAYEFFLEVEQRVRDGSAKAVALAAMPEVDVHPDVDGWLKVRSRIGLGRAARTEVPGLADVTADGLTITPHISAAGLLAVALNRPLQPFAEVHVSRLGISNGRLELSGRLHSGHSQATSARLLLKGRVSGRRAYADVALAIDERRTRRDFGRLWYRMELSADCWSLFGGPDTVDDTYDAWLEVTTDRHMAPFERRIGRTHLIPRGRPRAGWATRDGLTVAVAPYYTFKARKASFLVNTFEEETFDYLRREVRRRHLTRLRYRGDQIWLVGERPYKAQDTGYWFFRYLRANHPEIDAYYVIDPDSPERANVAPFGHVVDFGSKEHIRLSLLASTVLGSHHPDFLYPLRSRGFTRAVRATRVFLQHGVMGTKWMATLYGKGQGDFRTDLFIVSSEREREYIVSDFGYDPDEVAVTGLSRFDSLFAGDVALVPGQVLVMPTWRDWLQDPDAYPESEYHQTWSGLLTDPRLLGLVEEHDLKLVFCLHPNMQQYAHLFDHVPARVVAQGEVDVQHLLKQSSMLITDYSSVGFDFAFLHKPVVYFQFDQERFLAPVGSHLDLHEELPGPVLRSPSHVVDELAARAGSGFSMPEEYQRRADRFLTHRDRNSCDRIFEAALRARRKANLKARIAGNEFVVAVPKYLRRHRLYFPVMRRFYRLARLLPMDGRLVVFESGVGRQFGDSPRYVYEELARQRPDLKKVWSYNGRLPVADPRTTVVERLSPGYFWHLARARYWVNNQSFPHYITRRPDGVYLQTWHGTPLKRMLHDLDQVHGRSAGYVDRATRAAEQWSILVSPNSHTTRTMRSAFRYRGEVLEVGYPRNDVLHSADREDRAARVRARLGIRPDQRVILYAPTFRDDEGSGRRFTFALPFDLEQMAQALGGDTVLAVRMHVLVSSRIDIPVELRDFVRDLSAYPDIQELYLISDVLVTDYSSVFFDYASLRRPIVFYAYDLAKYRDTLRGFYLDYESDLPGPIVETQAELIDALTHLNEVEARYQEKRDEFVARFCPKDDGRASERVVRAVFGEDRGGGATVQRLG